ncbi:MAG: hypothetical protein FD159_824 [Syntrophaceae bacterium]|nr:MAG: hypothetical protein FD159_824 [Syntrophaceae bacterium]
MITAFVHSRKLRSPFVRGELCLLRFEELFFKRYLIFTIQLILSGQQETFTVTHFADAFIAVDHAGCTVVSRTSAAMRARDGVFWNGYLTIASTGLADSCPAKLDPAGCTVVYRSSTAMKASDHRHVCSSLSSYTISLLSQRFILVIM